MQSVEDAQLVPGAKTSDQKGGGDQPCYTNKEPPNRTLMKAIMKTEHGKPNYSYNAKYTSDPSNMQSVEDAQLVPGAKTSDQKGGGDQPCYTNKEPPNRTLMKAIMKTEHGKPNYSYNAKYTSDNGQASRSTTRAAYIQSGGWASPGANLLKSALNQVKKDTRSAVPVVYYKPVCLVPVIPVQIVNFYPMPSASGAGVQYPQITNSVDSSDLSFYGTQYPQSHVDYKSPVSKNGTEARNEPKQYSTASDKVCDRVNTPSYTSSLVNTSSTQHSENFLECAACDNSSSNTWTNEKKKLRKYSTKTEAKNGVLGGVDTPASLSDRSGTQHSENFLECAACDNSSSNTWTDEKKKLRKYSTKTEVKNGVLGGVETPASLSDRSGTQHSENFLEIAVSDNSSSNTWTDERKKLNNYSTKKTGVIDGVDTPAFHFSNAQSLLRFLQRDTSQDKCSSSQTEVAAKSNKTKLKSGVNMPTSKFSGAQGSEDALSPTYDLALKYKHSNCLSKAWKELNLAETKPENGVSGGADTTASNLSDNQNSTPLPEVAHNNLPDSYSTKTKQKNIVFDGTHPPTAKMSDISTVKAEVQTEKFSDNSANILQGTKSSNFASVPAIFKCPRSCFNEEDDISFEELIAERKRKKFITLLQTCKDLSFYVSVKSQTSDNLQLGTASSDQFSSVKPAKVALDSLSSPSPSTCCLDYLKLDPPTSFANDEFSSSPIVAEALNSSLSSTSQKIGDNLKPDTSTLTSLAIDESSESSKVSTKSFQSTLVSKLDMASQVSVDENIVAEERFSSPCPSTSSLTSKSSLDYLQIDPPTYFADNQFSSKSTATKLDMATSSPMQQVSIDESIVAEERFSSPFLRTGLAQSEPEEQIDKFLFHTLQSSLDQNVKKCLVNDTSYQDSMNTECQKMSYSQVLAKVQQKPVVVVIEPKEPLNLSNDSFFPPLKNDVKHPVAKNANLSKVQEEEEEVDWWDLDSTPISDAQPKSYSQILAKPTSQVPSNVLWKCPF